jgi:8-oxo-dGTP pyrophosphatase MutT (NUDIX family)
MIDHYIQKDILSRLTHAAYLRFSELKPEGMESNIFMYHLKQLLSQGYVDKIGTGYQLAPKGLSYVDGLSTTNHKPREQPKLIAIIALHDDTGRWLLAERKIQPYIGTRMFPSGKQHRGETSAEHVSRELQEKTGLSDIPLLYRGTADIQISTADDEPLTHAVASVYEGQLFAAALPDETDRFRFVWHDFTADMAPLMPGTDEVHAQLIRPGMLDITINAKQM